MVAVNGKELRLKQLSPTDPPLILEDQCTFFSISTTDGDNDFEYTVTSYDGNVNFKNVEFTTTENTPFKSDPKSTNDRDQIKITCTLGIICVLYRY